MIPDGHGGDADLSRRTFLSRVTVFLGALLALFVSGTGLGFFLSPLLRKEEEDWVDVGRARDFPKGVPARVEFVERKRDAWVVTEHRAAAWVVTADGRQFISFDPRCTHLGCPFRWDDGRKQFLCPCHTAVFGVDGAVVSGPAPRALDRYPVKVVSGRLQILPRAVSKEA